MPAHEQTQSNSSLKGKRMKAIEAFNQVKNNLEERANQLDLALAQIISEGYLLKGFVLLGINDMVGNLLVQLWGGKYDSSSGSYTLIWTEDVLPLMQLVWDRDFTSQLYEQVRDNCLTM